jgi:hypothetical protein
MNVPFLIYLILCGIIGYISGISNIGLKDWRHWVMLGCVMVAYTCGTLA